MTHINFKHNLVHKLSPLLMFNDFIINLWKFNSIIFIQIYKIQGGQKRGTFLKHLLNKNYNRYRNENFTKY